MIYYLEEIREKNIKERYMYYITLDLEWNQAYAQKALAVQKQLKCRLRGEVIQIGAVKLDKHMRPCGSYQIIVKPKYFKKIHRHVAELTGISQERMDAGIPLEVAAERFRAFCGKNFAFLTWGPDDIPMLKENFNAHGIDSSWLESTYDLQLIFNRQTENNSKQRSLEYAMEYYEIPQLLPAHDALNDAYFTALVAKRLDVIGGIKSYNDKRGEILESGVIGDADAGDDGYVTVTEMLSDDTVASPVCPICKRKMKQMGKMLHSKGQKYSAPFLCESDGEMLETLRLHRNFNDTWRAKRTIQPYTEELRAQYELGLERNSNRRKSDKKRPRPRRRPRGGSEKKNENRTTASTVAAE